ncbi:MAG: hypothetical protein A2V64_13210 [Bacteroidetes bacterium RBG_13_43_22]|nr:MAG: hypothetical protein A2V64_13210 [Bacteroidetes bacterium RBG_13_43_22]
MAASLNEDKRVVLTLDAGGTNFVFSAIQGNKELIAEIIHPSYSDDLDKCLESIIHGFEEVKSELTEKICAISFAFPGPADYNLGIIGDLPNLGAFRNGVALGPLLEDYFQLPVFINNDGNLFAYGEALTGYLPYINKRLKDAGSIKSYNNLIGITLGTGFGCGIVIKNILLTGDNSCGAEIHNTLNKCNPDWNAEESISTRAIQRVYAVKSGLALSKELMPKDIYDIARSKKNGNQNAAFGSFREFGEALGSSIANVLTLIDGIVVLGGGITAAWDIFAPAMFKEINKNYFNLSGNPYPRLSFKVFNLEDNSTFPEFSSGSTKEIRVPKSSRMITYDNIPRTGIGISKSGASKAIALGAYAFALHQLDFNK